MNSRAIALAVAVVVCGCATLHAAPYVWVGPANGDWLSPANWSGTPAFANDWSDVGDINSGGTANVTTSNATFQGRINVNGGGTLNQQSYKARATVLGSLHLNGGTVTIRDADTLVVNGGISVDANSTLNALGGDNAAVTAVFSGSGNLAITNSQPGNRQFSMNVDNSTGYAGTMTLGGTGRYSITGNLGGTVHIGPTIAGASYNCSKATYGPSPASWQLDLAGKTLAFGNENNEQTGQISLLSAAVIQSNTDYYGKITTLSGRITGAGKLTLYSNMSRDVNTLALVVASSLNDYSGGTEIKGGPTEAAAAHSLGTGNVEVDPGAQLKVDVSDVMNAAASLYLDFNSAASTYGRLNLAAGSVTTVAAAYVGGTGGWAAPAGYTSLAPGTYDSGNLGSYIIGTGALVVLPEPGALGLLVIGGLAAGRRLRRGG